MLDFIELDKTKLLNFSNISNNESILILDWRNNEDIRKWMYNQSIITLEEHYSFLKKLKYDKNNLYFIVKDLYDNYIGVIYLNKINFFHKNSYLGIYKSPNSKLSGKLLMESIIDLAFKILNLHTLKLEVREDNIKAIKFYESFGFRVEGILHDFFFTEDGWKNVLIMGKINND